MFSNDERQFIIALARQAIEHWLDMGEKLVLDSSGAPTTGALTETRACFVTLTKNFELRGCIGSIEAIKPLYLDVIDNAAAAAFEDDRFFPVTKEELEEIEIEVSVLTKPHRLIFSSAEDLFGKLTIGVDGVIVKRGNKSATYLPQVWDEMLEKHNFMSSLCLKAGLEPDDWQKPGLEVFTYQVEIIS